MPLIELGQHSLASVPWDNKKSSVVALHAPAVSMALRNSLGDAVTDDDRVFGGAPDGVAELVDTGNVPVADHD